MKKFLQDCEMYLAADECLSPTSIFRIKFVQVFSSILRMNFDLDTGAMCTEEIVVSL